MPLLAVKDVFLALLDDPSPPPSALVDALVAQAEALVCGYLGTPSLPAGNLEQPLALLALVLYNRRGTEGELKRMEGDVTAWFETLPEIIRLQLRPFRNAHVIAWGPPVNP